MTTYRLFQLLALDKKYLQIEWVHIKFDTLEQRSKVEKYRQLESDDSYSIPPSYDLNLSLENVPQSIPSHMLYKTIQESLLLKVALEHAKFTKKLIPLKDLLRWDPKFQINSAPDIVPIPMPDLPENIAFKKQLEKAILKANTFSNKQEQNLPFSVSHAISLALSDEKPVKIARKVRQQLPSNIPTPPEPKKRKKSKSKPEKIDKVTMKEIENLPKALIEKIKQNQQIKQQKEQEQIDAWESIRANSESASQNLSNLNGKRLIESLIPIASKIRSLYSISNGQAKSRKQLLNLLTSRNEWTLAEVEFALDTLLKIVPGWIKVYSKFIIVSRNYLWAKVLQDVKRYIVENSASQRIKMSGTQSIVKYNSKT